MAALPGMPNVLTVGELLARLTGVDPRTPIVLSRDAEGNGYSPLVDVDDTCRYLPYNAWSGEAVITVEAALAAGLDPEEYGAIPAGEPGYVDVLVLQPLN